MIFGDILVSLNVCWLVEQLGSCKLFISVDQLTLAQLNCISFIGVTEHNILVFKHPTLLGTPASINLVSTILSRRAPETLVSVCLVGDKNSGQVWV